MPLLVSSNPRLFQELKLERRQSQTRCTVKCEQTIMLVDDSHMNLMPLECMLKEEFDIKFVSFDRAQPAL
jgi:hypothetical protein